MRQQRQVIVGRFVHSGFHDRQECPARQDRLPWLKWPNVAVSVNLNQYEFDSGHIATFEFRGAAMMPNHLRHSRHQASPCEGDRRMELSIMSLELSIMGITELFFRFGVHRIDSRWIWNATHDVTERNEPLPGFVPQCQPNAPKALNERDLSASAQRRVIAQDPA